MTYQELINNIRSLGFSDDAEMQEFAESGVLYDSINRAITELNLNVAPNVKRYEFDIDSDEEDYLYINMTDVDKRFLDFADTPVLFSETDGSTEVQLYTVFNDYRIEAGDTVVIETGAFRSTGSHSFRIFYKAEHETFDGTRADEDLPLPRKIHHLVPLLASYYVWLEDEPAKAAQYYNTYEQLGEEIKSQSVDKRARIRVLPGGI